MKNIKKLFIALAMILAIACSKEKTTPEPDIKGVMSVKKEQTLAYYDTPYVYRFKMHINRDANVVGENILTLDKATQQGKGFVYFDGNLATTEGYKTKSNEVIVEYLPLTDEDKNKPFLFNIIRSEERRVGKGC